MRDPERIDLVLAALRALWRQHPDWRLGQIIVNATHDVGFEPNPNLFYIEDDALVDRLLVLAELFQ